MVFANWDGRPAVLFSVGSGEALALLEKGGDWAPVDALDVDATAAVVGSEDELKGLFASTFGAFDLPKSFDGFTPASRNAAV